MGLSDGIRKIPEAIRISKKASRIIVENVIIAFSTKSLVLELALVHYSMLLSDVVTDIGTCLLVILNNIVVQSAYHQMGVSLEQVVSFIM
ncbi:hypothetical protein SOVF_198190 [Spinacia oleracea]|nr:hypothetical protein SOVF_198190 [Spinacia oleracea]